jgi:voltage-gated potassium channel
MKTRLTLFLDFVQTFAHYASHIREVIASLLLLVVLGGYAISTVEDIKLGDAVYFAFITALSIGYGDITPMTTIGKLVSVGIGLVGMLFAGVTVAIANRALADTAKRYLERNN